MRLLRTKDLELCEFGGREVPNYAILSHTWGKEEVTLQDIKTKRPVKLQGYEKVSKACEVATVDGFDYIWIDTCCIDKTSSAELSEALNSMYRWYQEAEECYAYLADVPHNSNNQVTGIISPEFLKSRWFNRGWTLQELIAPLSVIFLDDEWQEIGTKSNLLRHISEITGIPDSFLLGDDLRHASIAQRMSWASKRETTRTEDLAYCLMGLFGIYMPMLYGEGERAFIRLQEEIMRVSDDHSLFAWRSTENHGGILANSPAAFANSGNIIPVNPAYATSSPSTISSRGIHLSLRFINNDLQGKGLAVLHCTEIGKENMRLAIHLRDVSLTNEDFVREQSTAFILVDIEDIDPLQHSLTSMYIRQWHSTRNKNWEGIEKCVIKLAGINAQEATSRITNFSSNCNLSDGLIIINMKDISDGLLSRLLLLCKDKSLFQLQLTKHGRSVSADVNAVTANLQDTQNLHVSEQEQNDQDRIVKALGNGRHVHIAIKRRVLLLQGERSLTVVVEISYSSTVKGLWAEHVSILEKEIQEKTLMSYVAKRGVKMVFEHLLEQEGIESKSNDDLRTPLSWAAEGGQEEIVKLLLERGAAIESQDKYGRTTLSVAARSGHVAIVTLLLAKAAVLEEIEKTIDDQKPQSRAGWQRLFLAKDAKVKLRRNDGRVSRRLLNLGDRLGRTPLHWAAIHGYIEIVKLLLENGADLRCVDDCGRTPLHRASGNGHVKAVKLLLEKGADLKALDIYKSTPLHWASENGHIDVVKLLLVEGADLKAFDKIRRTPLHWARKNGHIEVALLLDKWGADSKVADRYKGEPLY